MYPVSEEFNQKILAPERRVLGKVEIEYMKETQELPYDDSSLTYTGTWTFDQREGAEGTWGFPVLYATEEEASVEFSFYGTRVYWKAFSWMQDRGIAECYIDGVLTKTLDLGIGGNLSYYTFKMHEEKLERGHHTAKIVCTGESGEFSGGTRIDIIGFEIEDDITETYTGDNLFLMRILEEREDVESGSIPVGNISANEIDIRLDNSDRKFTPGNIDSPLHGLLKKNLKVRAWLGVERDSGDKEWVPLGVFYTISWDAPDNELYCHVTARDKLDQLRETDYTTSKAIVAASALPAPVFTRESAAYKDDGTQIAANVPRFKDGAVLIEGATTNLITDPFFADISKWPVNAYVYFGSDSQGTFMTLCQGAPGQSGYCYQPYKFAAGEVGSITVYMRMSDGSEPMLGGGAGQLSVVIEGIRCHKTKERVPGTDLWKLTGTRVAQGTGVNTGVVYYSAPGNAWPIFRKIQLEKGPPTSFTPTTRAGEGLKLPAAGVLDNREGTVEFDLLVNDSYRNTEEMCLFSFASWFFQGNPYWGMNSIRLFRYDGEFMLWSNSYWSAGNVSQGSALDNLSDGWHRFAIRWQETELALFVDGEKVISISNPNLPIYVHEYSSVGCLYFLTAEATPQEKYYMQCNTLIGAARYSLIPRSDDLLAVMNPLEPDEWTSFFMGFDGDLSVSPDGVPLYTLLETVLQDAGLNQNEYWIDPALRSVLVPAAYFDTQKHREALRKIAEAGLAVAYCRREDGRLIIETLKNPLIDEQTETVFLHPAFPAEIETVQVYGIGADDYFPGKRHPDAEIKNSISVTTQPLLPGERKEVYKSEEITLKAGAETSITAFFDKSPCFGAVPEVDSPYQVDIISATHYAWGMYLKIKNNHSETLTFTFSITAYPLEVRSQQVVTKEDEVSIAENGLKSYDFPDNPLVQSTSVAQVIADNLLAVYSPARRDVELDWRGNPALELGDVVCVPEYQRDGIDARGHYVVVQQEFEWDGGLRAKLTGRRIG